MRKVIVLGTVPQSMTFPILSWAIRFFEGSKESHVGLFFPSTNVVTDAHYNLVNVTNFVNYEKMHKIVESIELEISDEEYLLLMEYTKRKTGKQKGYWCTFFGTWFPIIIRRLTFEKIKLGNCCPLTKGLTCSVYLQSLFNYAHLLTNRGITINIPDYTLTTKDIILLSQKIAS